MREIRGVDALALVADQIAQHSGGIAKSLAKYDPADTASKLHATIRSVEEFINVPLFGLDDEQLLSALRSVALDARLLAEAMGKASDVVGRAISNRPRTH